MQDEAKWLCTVNIEKDQKYTIFVLIMYFIRFVQIDSDVVSKRKLQTISQTVSFTAIFTLTFHFSI
jgi:hypothetical protein